MNFSYPERRTIIRQNDPHACFYIVLSGSAIVSYKRISDDHVQTIDILSRGCTFGVGGGLSSEKMKLIFLLQRKKV